VREIGEEKGEHWHLLVHCPKPLRTDFYTYVRASIPKTRPRAVQIRAQRYEKCAGCGENRDWKHLVRCYFLKGGTREVRRRVGIDRCAASAAGGVYAADQGTILGKRLGYSKSFGRAARERAQPTSQMISNIPAGS
jgi:hypothetical protein